MKALCTSLVLGVPAVLGLLFALASPVHAATGCSQSDGCRVSAECKTLKLGTACTLMSGTVPNFPACKNIKSNTCVQGSVSKNNGSFQCGTEFIAHPKVGSVVRDHGRLVCKW